MARARRLAVAAVACAAVAALSACSWRMDTEPEPFRTPSPVTVLRDHVAAAESAAASAAFASTGDLAAAEVEATSVRLAALGGVSPTSSPRPVGTLPQALDAARFQALDCMDAAGEDPLGGLCASMALSHAAMDAAAHPSTATFAPLTPGADTTPPAATAADPDALSRLALEHDRLRAMLEVIAARSTGDERADALAASALQRGRVAALLAVQGVEDRRSPAYDIPVASVATAEARAATLRATHVALAEAYSALLVTAAPHDRGWLLNAAFEAYVAAVGVGLGLGDVPALPGAATGS